MAAIVQAEALVFEVEDNYQKQTYRTRTYIAHSNGKLLLNVPIKHTKNGVHQKMKDVLVENEFPWQAQHWKSLQSAYRTSPFFEFYEDDMAPLFKTPVTSLLEHNLNIYEFLNELIGIETSHTLSTKYHKTPEEKDLRYLAKAKGNSFKVTPYTQVFEANHSFLHNLSILDLLFNEGPNTLNYLESLTLDL